MVRVGALR